MEIFAFFIAIPVAVELIAALYGPIDLSYEPRLMWFALLRVLALSVIAAGLGLWLGWTFVIGLVSVALLFVLKHWLIALAYRLPAEYKLAIWT